MVIDIILGVSPLILPIVAAVAALGLSYISKNVRNAGLLLIIGIAFIINTILTFQVVTNTFIPIELGALIINESGVFIAELVITLSLLVVIYSIRYMQAERDDTLYYILVCIFTGTMIGLIYSFNLIILYMFLEASTVTSAILVMYGRTRRANRAAIIYLTISI